MKRARDRAAVRLQTIYRIFIFGTPLLPRNWERNLQDGVLLQKQDRVRVQAVITSAAVSSSHHSYASPPTMGSPTLTNVVHSHLYPRNVQQPVVLSYVFRCARHQGISRRQPRCGHAFYRRWHFVDVNDGGGCEWAVPEGVLHGVSPQRVISPERDMPKVKHEKAGSRTFLEQIIAECRKEQKGRVR